MRSAMAAVVVLGLFSGAAAGDIVLKNNADIDMTGSAGSQLIFPDGSTLSSALGAVPAGHGGVNNTVTGTNAYVGGGSGNSATHKNATVGAGQSNTAGARYATVGGGLSNVATGNYASVGGGRLNQALAAYATIAGGGPTDVENPNTYNRVSDDYGTVGGGAYNHAGDEAGTTIDAHFATVSGGFGNIASGPNTTIGGGGGNEAYNAYDTISGGSGNVALGAYASVGGGKGNSASGLHATVAGGESNSATGTSATVGGGDHNTITGSFSVIGGGTGNTVSNDYTTISGGASNIASGYVSTVIGGIFNSAGGYAATVSGNHSIANGSYSFAAGRRAQIDGEHHGSFMFADQSDFAFSSTAVNQFSVRATGGVRFVTAINGSGGTVHQITMDNAGNLFTTGTVNPPSDRNAKENFTPVNAVEVLEKVAALPIATWNYKEQNADARHMGTTAQDFAAAFGLGDSDKHIATVDADGVALAAIQGLNAKLEQRAATIESQGALIATLMERVEALERRNLAAP